jgi:hypothetical protein
MRGVGSLQSTNQHRDQITSKRQIFHLILFHRKGAIVVQSGAGGDVHLLIVFVFPEVFSEVQVCDLEYLEAPVGPEGKLRTPARRLIGPAANYWAWPRRGVRWRRPQ